MSGNTRWSQEDMQRLGLIEVNGHFVPVKSVTTPAYRVNKFPAPIYDSKGQLLNKPTKPAANKKINQPVSGEIPADSKGCDTIRFKPMSVNDAWKGKRYRSDQYNDYRHTIAVMLPKHLTIPTGFLKVYYEFGLSSNGGDWDNPVKPFQDILQETYHFNDSKIMEATVKKVIVAKGSEYIRFKIEAL